MKPHLKHALYWITAAALVAVMWACGGCAHAGDKALSYCVPESIYCAWTWGARHHVPVRLAVQHVRPHVDHVQAEALIDGVWTPLTPQWDHEAGRIKVVPWQKHFDVEPYRYLSLEDWIGEQIEYVRH